MTRTDRSLLLRWIAARVRLMLRNPRVTFFTFAFPLMFLVIFSAINGDVRVPAPGTAGGEVRFAQFYAPSIGIFGLTPRLLHERDLRTRQRTRRGAAQARARHAAADAGLPRLVADRRGAARDRQRGADVRGGGPRLRRRHLPGEPARRRRDARARRGLAGGARPRGVDAGAQRRPGRPGGAAHAAAADVHLRRLVAARRRAGLDRRDRPRVPALLPRRGVRRLLRAADDRRRLGAGQPGRDRGLGRGGAARRRPALPGGAEHGRARPLRAAS